MTAIPEYAFYGCSSLAELKIPDTVTAIPEYAFYGCSSLAELKIPDAVTSIGTHAFYNCSSLTEIKIPASVNSIENAAFSYCNALTSVIIEDGDNNLEINSSQNWGKTTTLYLGRSCTFSQNTEFLKELKNLTIGPKVAEIPASTFYHCSALTSLTVADSETPLTFGENAIPDNISTLYMGRNWSGAQFSGLSELTIGQKITEIPDNAFKGSKNLASVTLPDALTAIGPNAFYGCSSLTTINIPDAVKSIGNYAFDGCSGLTTVNISNALSEIGSGTFRDCSALTSVNVPETVTSIHNSAFYNCSALKSVTLPDVLTEIGESAFERSGLTSIKIPDAVTTISHYAFRGCKLTEIIIPESVTSIGNRAFYCDNLTEVIIEDSDNALDFNTRISNYAYDTNQNLTFGNNITNLYLGRNYQCNESSSSPFKGITTLTSATIGPKVTELSYPAFYGCSALKSLTVADSDNTLTLSENAINSSISVLYIGRNWSGKQFNRLTELTIGPKVTEIPDNAFKGSYNLASVTLPDALTTIGSNAFSGCSGLTEIKIPDAVTSIATHAFDGCSGLTEIKIPAAVASIGSDAFRGCSNLASVTLEHSENLLFLGNPGHDGTNHVFGSNIGDLYIGRNLGWSSTSDSPFAETSVKNVTIENIVSEIKESTFRDCHSLATASLPENLTSIGPWAFKGCYNLASITVPASVTSVGEKAFYGCSRLADLKIADSYTPLAFGSDALTSTAISTLYIGRNWTDLTLSSLNSTLKTVTIGKMMTDVQSQAFSGCSGLTQVNLPVDGALSAIGDNAFNGCSGLTEMKIPDAVNSIGDNAFDGCSSLTEINIPNAVTSIGGGVFQDCSALTEIKIPATVNSIGSNAFNRCSALKSMIVPSSVQTVGSDAFANCSGLIKSAYPEHLNNNPFPSGIAISYMAENSTIDDKGVIYDSNKVYFAPLSLAGAYTVIEGMTAIGDNAFAKCTGLTQVSLPAGLTTIGDKAFAGCPGLATIISLSTNPPAAVESSFQGLYDTAMVELTDGAIENYLYADVWPNFKNIKGASLYSDNVFKYRLISDSRSAILVKNGDSYNSMTVASIPSRVVEESASGDATFYNVTGIGPDAFNGCTMLTKITWPTKLEQIAEKAFKGCTGLTEITLPNSLTTIGASAFENATYLKSVTLSESLTEIGDRAFSVAPHYRK